ncbi:MAG TPA: hypothetical protein ENJ46_04225, partial [Hellea balneolensis]|nr:hypothetical protein [Hellea balneolensis]
MSDFLEERAEFKGFNRYYNAEILPFLHEKEAERQKLVSKGYKVGFGIAALGVVIAVFATSRGAPPMVFFVVAALGAIIGMISGAAVLGSMKKEIKQHLVGRICQFLGWEFVEK